MRKGWRIGGWMLIWAALAHAAPVTKAPPSLDREVLTPAERNWLTAHPVSYQSTTPGDYPPMEFYGANGSFTGISADYLNLVAARLGVRVERRWYDTWPKAVAALSASEADIVASVVPTAERARQMGLSDPYLPGRNVIVVRRGDVRIRSPADLVGRRLSNEFGLPKRLALTAAIPNLQFVDVDDTVAALRSVSSGATDAYVGNGLVVDIS